MILKAHQVSRIFSQGKRQVKALDGVDFCVEAGQSHAILGKSGAGKSTLIQLLAGFDRPTGGQVFWQGKDAATLKGRHIDRARQSMFGFVHQHHHLLSDMDAISNVALPLRIAGLSKHAALDRAQEVLDRVGLSHRHDHLPGELSGGERQRVGIARALAGNPAVIIADEPTGNLDPHTAQDISRLLTYQVQHRQGALIIVTHSPDVAQTSQFQWTLEAGKLTTHAVARSTPVLRLVKA